MIKQDKNSRWSQLSLKEKAEIIRLGVKNGMFSREDIINTFETGGELPIDWSGIKTTNNRPYNQEYIDYIDNKLTKAGLSNLQKAGIIGNIIEESGGNPFAVDSTNTYNGLLQWGAERYAVGKEKDPYREIDNQIQYLLNTIDNLTDSKSWTHGGKGSGYNSLKDAHKKYSEGETLEDVMHGFTWGYVRPAGKQNSYLNRLKVAQQIYDLYK